MANYLPEIEGKTKTEEMHGPVHGPVSFSLVMNKDNKKNMLDPPRII